MPGKPTIDHVVRKPPRPSRKGPEQSPTISTGLPIERQIRKRADKGGPPFWPPAFLIRSPPRLGR
jgi:hypothetical protein